MHVLVGVVAQESHVGRVEEDFAAVLPGAAVHFLHLVVTAVNEAGHAVGVLKKQVNC